MMVMMVVVNHGRSPRGRLRASRGLTRKATRRGSRGGHPPAQITGVLLKHGVEVLMRRIHRILGPRRCSWASTTRWRRRGGTIDLLGNDQVHRLLRRRAELQRYHG